MSIRNTDARWGAVAQLLHWSIVVLMATQVTLGLTLKSLHPGPTFFAIIDTHKSIGMTILALAVIRLLWRWANPVPELPGTLQPYERVLARLTHAGLYVIIFAMPLTGWIGSSAHGFTVKWFGLFAVPNPVSKDLPLSAFMGEAHTALAIAFGLIVTLHIAATFKHHFVLRDDTLRRMLPGEQAESGARAEAGTLR
jgi:cytochrome b561